MIMVLAPHKNAADLRKAQQDKQQDTNTGGGDAAGDES
jgi:hypothetical protein